jgi:hypothetical protein
MVGNTKVLWEIGEGGYGTLASANTRQSITKLPIPSPVIKNTVCNSWFKNKTDITHKKVL